MNWPKARCVRWTVAIVMLSILAVAEAQYFGKNKVVWERLDFEVLETDHFRIHYYPRGAAVAEDLARLAERWYGRLSKIFGYEFEERRALIIYQDHADFQQTVVSLGLIGEGTGGFTESLRSRVVLPLTGVNEDNDHVIGHEMVHVFQFDLARRRPTTGPQAQPQSVPLFLVEGLAEYLSEGRDDAHTAMFLRDAVLHDVLPSPRRFGRLRLSPYQYGQALWAYVGGRWSDETVIQLYNEITTVGMTRAFPQVLDLTLETFFEEFHGSLRSAYRPVLDERHDAEDVAKPLVTAELDGGRMNMAPSLSPDGRWMAFLSSRELLSLDLFLADARSGEVIRKVVSSAADRHFDSLSFLNSSVAWSPDSQRLAFAVFQQGEQRLAIFDVGRGRIARYVAVPDVKGMRQPVWSPDGERLVFSAIEGGGSDLYMVDLESGELTRLTDDRYSALMPTFSPDGLRIAFVTDRGSGTDLDELSFGELQIALLELETRRIEVLPIFGRGKHIDPHFSSDGSSLYFIGAPDGVPDVFRYDFGDASIERLTALKIGVSGLTAKSPALSVAAQNDAIAYSVLENGRWGIYRLVPGRERPFAPLLEPGLAARLPPWPPDAKDSVVEDYLSRPGLDLPPSGQAYAGQDYDDQIRLTYLGAATVGVGVTNYGVGASGTFHANFSDDLRTHELDTTLFGGGVVDTVFGIEDTLGADVRYVDRTRRWWWGTSASRTPYIGGATFFSRGLIDIDGATVAADVIDDVFEIQTVNRVTSSIAYPFSTAQRIEGAIGITHIGFERKLQRLTILDTGGAFLEETDLPAPEPLDLQDISLAYVLDDSQFGFVSPLRGSRFRYETGWTTGDLDFRTSLFDYRRYLFVNPLTFAFRLLHVARFGEDVDDLRLSRFDVSHSTLVRGYDGFSSSECTRTIGLTTCPEFERFFGSRMGVLKFELRVPVLGTEDFGFFRAPMIPMEGIFFVDIGAAWNAGDPIKWHFERNTVERVPIMSAGIAVRMLIAGALPIEFYYAKPYQRPSEDAVFGFMITTGW